MAVSRNTKDPEETTRSTSGNHHPKKPLPKKRRPKKKQQKSQSRKHTGERNSQPRAKVTPTTLSNYGVFE